MTKLYCHHDRAAVCNRCQIILASQADLAARDASMRPVAVVEGERRWVV